MSGSIKHWCMLHHRGVRPLRPVSQQNVKLSQKAISSCSQTHIVPVCHHSQNECETDVFQQELFVVFETLKERQSLYFKPKQDVFLKALLLGRLSVLWAAWIACFCCKWCNDSQHSLPFLLFLGRDECDANLWGAMFPLHTAGTVSAHRKAALRTKEKSNLNWN